MGWVVGELPTMIREKPRKRGGGILIANIILGRETRLSQQVLIISFHKLPVSERCPKYNSKNLLSGKSHQIKSERVETQCPRSPPSFLHLLSSPPKPREPEKPVTTIYSLGCEMAAVLQVSRKHLAGSEGPT